MVDQGNLLLPFRMAFVFCQQLFQTEIVPTFKSSINLICQMKIFCGIYCETQVPLSGLQVNNLYFEAPLSIIDLGHNVFALVGLLSLSPGFFQGLHRANLCVHANRCGALKWRREAVSGEIRTARQVSPHYPIDLFRRDHGAVGRDTHNHICLRLPGCLVKAVQNVKLISPIARQAGVMAILHKWIVN